MMNRLPRLGLGALGLASIAAFTVVSAIRLVCPIELGNGEGMMLDHAIRLAQGKPIYVAPSLDFIPFAYMPLYPALVAPLVAWFGPELWQGRLVDLLSVYGFLAVLVYVVKRETGSWALALGGAGIFLMGQGLTRGGYDVVRPDPLMLLFAFAGLAVLRFTHGLRGVWVAAVLGALGFFDKQHGIMYALAGAPYLYFFDRRRFLPYLGAVALTCGGGFLLLTWWLGPWFPFYTWEVPSKWSEFSRARVFDYFGDILAGMFGALVIPSALALAAPGDSRSRAASIWWWVGLASVGTGLMATLDPYAYYHTLMPTLAGFSVLGPIALDRIARRLEVAGSTHASSAVCLVLALQYLPLLYPMHVLLPHPGTAETRRDIVAKLRSLPDPVLMPYHGFYLTVAGKPVRMSLLPLDDVVRAKGNRLLKRDPHYFDRMFDSLRAGPNRPVIVNDTLLTKTGDATTDLWTRLEGGYRRTGDLGTLITRLKPVIGGHNSPTWIYTPVEPAESDSAVAARASAADTGVAPAAKNAH